MENPENIFTNGEELPKDPVDLPNTEAGKKKGRPRKPKVPKPPTRKSSRPRKQKLETPDSKPQTHVCEWLNCEKNREKCSTENIPKLFESKNVISFVLCDVCLSRLNNKVNRLTVEDNIYTVNISLCQSCVGGNICTNKNNYQYFVA